MATYTDNQIENMKQILTEQFEYNFNYQDAQTHEEISNLEDGMYTYSVVGFEAYAFIDVSTCISSGIKPLCIVAQIDSYEEMNKDLLESALICDNDYIDFSIQVNLANNTIESKVSLDHCVSVFKEDIDYDNFEDQCKRASEAL